MPKGREHEFAKGFIKLWQVMTNGWAFHIPDSYHVDKKTKNRFSHKRPADWLVACPAYSALIEFKFLPGAWSFKPMAHLRQSQVDTVFDLDMRALRYFLVVGNGDGAWSWECSHSLFRRWDHQEVRLDLGGDNPCVGWYPYSGLNVKGDPGAMLK